MRAEGPDPGNDAMADKLDEVATLLTAQGADRFRVSAYRNGAATLRQLSRPAAEILDEGGLDGLVRLPAIGTTLARAIRTMLRTGHLPQLERLRGEGDPEALLRTLPGIGPALAERVHHELGVDSLEDLEAAVHDGRLASLPGFGPKRSEGVRAALGARLRRVRRHATAGASLPSVDELLDVDREYRARAEADELPRIAPRRMNPDGRAWLPVLHTRRGTRDYAAMYSNTPLAHRLGRTDDWVVLYPENGAGERPFTVVTETRGPLKGRRVVRGREAECRRSYGLDAVA